MADITTSTVVLNTAKALTAVACAAAAKTYDFSLSDERNILIINNISGGAILTGVISEGSDVFFPDGSKTFTVADGAISVLHLEGAKYKSSTAKVTITYSIATGGTIGSATLYHVILPIS